MEFGTVHTVFAGRFKDDLQGICNGKRHIRLTPDGSKHDLPYEVQFPGDERFVNVLWTEKIISCKKCYSNHISKTVKLLWLNKMSDQIKNIPSLSLNLLFRSWVQVILKL